MEAPRRSRNFDSLTVNPGQTPLCVDPVSSAGSHIANALFKLGGVGLRRSIYRWNGDPVAFVEDGWLFDYHGRYLGWIEADSSVWGGNGQHIGELIDGIHVLRNTTALPRMPRFARVAPEPSPPPRPFPVKIMPLPPMYGWIDAFDVFYLTPNP